jgi:hypothetical protein
MIIRKSSIYTISSEIIESLSISVRFELVATTVHEFMITGPIEFNFMSMGSSCYCFLLRFLKMYPSKILNDSSVVDFISFKIWSICFIPDKLTID